MIEVWFSVYYMLVCRVLFVSSRRRHTRCALVTGVQTCALPILAGVQVNGHSIDGTNVDAAGERPARSMSEFKAVIVRHAADRRGKFIEPRARVAHRGVPVESAAGAVRRLDLEPIEMGRAGIDDMRVVYAHAEVR